MKRQNRTIAFFKLILTNGWQKGEIFLPYDALLSVEQGKVNASFLDKFINRKIGLGLTFEEVSQGFLIKNGIL